MYKVSYPAGGKVYGYPVGEKQQAILMALNSIPPGHVTSYGEVAKRAGLPGYARLVCRVLRDLPDRAQTPWWRVVRADGRSAMSAESQAGAEQRRRLKSEGVAFKGEKILGPWW
jgi:methylated-DNA-protein-cysteine methyltransferase-like protein